MIFLKQKLSVRSVKPFRLPSDLNFDGDVRKKLHAKYCIVTFPGDYSGDFGLFLDSNDPTTCCACVFQADCATSQFLGPSMVSVKGKHAGALAAALRSAAALPWRRRSLFRRA